MVGTYGTLLSSQGFMAPCSSVCAVSCSGFNVLRIVRPLFLLCMHNKE